jgi:hypothetical protein
MLYAYKLDATGCGFYRLQAVYDALPPDKKEQVKVVDPGDPEGIVANMVNGIVRDVTIPDDCTGIWTQRPTNVALVQALPFIQAAGLPVIIDVDDDLSVLSPRHPLWHILHPDPRSPGSHADMEWKHVIKCCRELADLVTASTPAIRDTYRPRKGGEVALLRNQVPEYFLSDKSVIDPVARYEPHVAWPGGILSHPDDLTAVGNALARLDVPIRIVGPKPPEGYPIQAKRLIGVEPDSYSGSIEFPEWMSYVRTIHTGIAPLEESRFNAAKSALKPLELSAAGVPFVRSCTPEYEALGAGLGASKPQHWYRNLQRLLKDDALRSEEAARNTAIARANTYEANWQQWWDAWASVGAVKS